MDRQSNLPHKHYVILFALRCAYLGEYGKCPRIVNLHRQPARAEERVRDAKNKVIACRRLRACFPHSFNVLYSLVLSLSTYYHNIILLTATFCFGRRCNEYKMCH